MVNDGIQMLFDAFLNEIWQPVLLQDIPEFNLYICHTLCLNKKKHQQR